MNQLTFFDKIQVLFQLLFSSPIIIGIFAFSMVLMIILFFYSRLNKKIIKYVFIGLYIVIGFAIIKYGSYFLTSLDSFVTLFMANIYFPIIPVYIVIMLISFIIMIITLSSKKKSRVVKIINTVFFTLIQMLFAVFIYIVESNDIDLSNNTGLYTNDQTMTLLELGMGLFFIWMIILLVIFYLKKADKIFKVKKNVEQDDFDLYINDFNEPKKSVEINSRVNDSVGNVNLVHENNDVGNINLVSDVSTNNVFQPESSINNGVNLVPEVSVDNSFGNSDLSSGIVNNYSTYSNLSNSIGTNSFDNGQFNNNIVDNMSTEFKNGFTDSFNSSFQSNDSYLNNSSYNNVNVSNSFNSNVDTISNGSSSTKPSNNVGSMNIFDNFDFLDVSTKPVERKNDDVEIIDFD